MSIADQTSYEVIYLKKGKPIKAWVRGVSLEPEARQQLINLAHMPFIHKHVAVMPDAHMGKGTTVGSVIPTFKAIIPAAVGVDLGCGMIAVKTSLRSEQLPDNLKPLRSAIERAVPVGFSWWKNDLESRHPAAKPVNSAWEILAKRYDAILEKHPRVDQDTLRPRLQLGTLGGGNHFIEILSDESGNVWLMLHSGRRAEKWRNTSSICPTKISPI